MTIIQKGEPMSDTISKKGVFIPDITVEMFRNASLESIEDLMASGEMEDILLPSAQPEQRWIPIKWHDCTDEDREKYGFNNDIVVVFDCEMPDDNQSILVTTSHGYVNQDVCYIDDGYSLDSGWDWIDDIKAWMPLPEPYKGGEQDE